MHYILNEDAKFILSERFTLLEAVTAADVTTLKNNLLAIVKDIDTSKTASGNQDTANAINKRLFVFQHSLDAIAKNNITKKLDPAAVKGECSQTIQQIEDILSKADPTFQKTVFEAEFKDLKTLATNDNYDKDTVKAIKAKVQNIANVLETLKGDYDSGNKDSRDSAVTIEDTITVLTRLVDFATKSTKANALAPLDTVLTNCTTAYNNYKADNKKLPELVAACKAVIKDSNELFASENYTQDATSSDDADWDKRYKKASNKETFWDQYYNEVWGNNGRRIRALGDAFRQECEALGFSSRTNPFIGFLQNYLVNKNYNISKDIYNVIHNAVREKKLSLKGLNSSTNIINPIFCKDFYSKSAGEAKEYLDAVGQIRAGVQPDIVLDANAADKISDPGEKAEFEAVISHFNPGDRNILQFIWVLLFDKPSLSALLHNGSPETLPASVAEIENAGLRSLTEIQKLLDILAPNLGSEKAFTTDTLTVLLNKFPTNTTEAAKWARVLIMTFLLPTDAIAFYNNYGKIDRATVTGVEEVNIKKTIFGLGTKMSKKNIQDILDSLEKKGVNLK